MGLFFTSGDEEVQKPKTVKKEDPASFPTQATTFPTPSQTFPGTPVAPAYVPPVSSNSFIQDVRNVYQTGFDSLNQPGIEFYEFIKAVEAVDINNGAAYKMAFTMLSHTDATFTKAKAIESSQFYVDNIIKAHKEFSNGGLQKKEQLIGQKSSEQATLTQEVNSLEAQLKQLETQLLQKKTELATIDSKYAAQLGEVEGKLQANEVVKEEFLNKIRTVVENIKSNL